jgi:hypothetical protein
MRKNCKILEHNLFSFLREGSGKLEETYYVTSRIYWKKLAQTASFVPENFENGGRIEQE